MAAFGERVGAYIGSMGFIGSMSFPEAGKRRWHLALDLRHQDSLDICAALSVV